MISRQSTIQSNRSLLQPNSTSTEKPYFTVQPIERQSNHTKTTSPALVHIEIFNHRPDKWYSVTVTSLNAYTGTATLVTGRPGTPLLYRWIPPFRGSYEFIVHELKPARLMHGLTLPLEGKYDDNHTTLEVVDRQGYDSRQVLLDQLEEEERPSCSTIRDRLDLYTVWDGTWIGPEILRGRRQREEGLRTGWYFLPGGDSTMSCCKIEYFTHEELSRNVDERSIYILGTSRERGVFLSLVDMILDTKEKAQLHDSVISKCWGRAYILKNNLKLFYQDWRAKFFSKNITSSDNYFICHDDNVARTGNYEYTNNGLKVWEEIFADRSSWPSVILMSTGPIKGFNITYDLQHFITTLPPTWQGTLFLTDGEFSALKAGIGDEAEYIEYRNFINESVYAFNDERVRWIDGKGISKEHRMHGENGPDHVTGSQHFHAHCNSIYLDESGTQQSMKICSNITEVLGQLLIGYALGSKDEYMERIKDSAATVPKSSYSPMASPTMLTDTSTCNARKIKLVTTTTQPIHLFEVQVMAENINVAEGKNASQSSTHNGNESKFGASKGVDGDMSSFFSTQAGNAGEYFEVDFNASYDVDSIKLHNRACPGKDDCLCRLSGVEVTLYDGMSNPLWAEQLGDTCDDQIITKTISSCANTTSSHVLSSSDPSPKELMYCHACPPGLLPFHITHHPDMTCAAGVLHPRTNNEILPPMKCPKQCLNITPSGTVQTQWKVVNERHCPVEIIMPPPDVQPKQETKQMANFNQTPPLERTNQEDVVVPQEPANQNMHPKHINQTRGSPEFNIVASYIPYEYNLLLVNLVNLLFVAFLACCYTRRTRRVSV